MYRISNLVRNEFLLNILSQGFVSSSSKSLTHKTKISYKTPVLVDPLVIIPKDLEVDGT